MVITKTITAILFFLVSYSCFSSEKIYHSASPNRLGEQSQLIVYSEVDSVTSGMNKSGYKLLGENWQWYATDVTYFYSNGSDTCSVWFQRSAKESTMYPVTITYGKRMETRVNTQSLYYPSYPNKNIRIAICDVAVIIIYVNKQ